MKRIVIALCIIFIPSCAFAWGYKGHGVIAYIAWERLTDKAKTEIEKLIDPPGVEEKFIHASTWADQIRRGRPETGPWHYVNIPYGSAGYLPSRDCSSGNCVVAKIVEFSNVVPDKNVLSALRVEALRFLIHFVADIHQPLHVANDNDRGGNDTWVSINNGPSKKLHAVWDTDVVNELGVNFTQIAPTLINQITPAQVSKWTADKPEDWANDSFKVACDFIYARSRGPNTQATPIILPPDYLRDASPIVAERLKMAGVRLAFLLNKL